MKKKSPILYQAIFLILLFANCAKNDNFTLPSLDCTNPTLSPNTSIENVSKIADDGIRVYPGKADDILSGIVISSDQGGNFYNKLYIVDDQTQEPAILNIEMASSFTEFPPGTKILLKLGNLYCTNSYGKLNIGGGIYTSSKDKKYIGSIPKNALAKYIEKYCDPVTDFNQYNHHITLQDLTQNTEEHTNKLITINTIQFDPRLQGKKLYDPNDVDAQGYTLRKLIDNQGNSCYIRTGKMSKDFVDYIILANSGSITGIADVFSKQIQFYPRVLEDLQFNQPPFSEEPENPEENGEPEKEVEEDIKVEPGQLLAFPGSDFEQWNDFITSLNKAGLKFATQGLTEGWNNSTGLVFRGFPTKIDNAFTVTNVSVPSNLSALSFLMKGKASKRSLSINIYNAEGHFIAYNLGEIQQSKIIQASPHTNQEGTVNQYNGTIDTHGEWVKIILPLSNFAYNQTGNGPFLAIRFGGKTTTIPSNYDLILDEIRFDQVPTE